MKTPASSDRLHVSAAMSFYIEGILRPLRYKIGSSRQYGFDTKTAGWISPRDWELFGAILLDRPRSQTPYGVDLDGVEVKSAVAGGNFEYQYHRDHGIERLADDAHVAHLFISYGADYQDIDVRLLRPEQTHDLVRSWRPRVVKAYGVGTSEKTLRCRPSVPFGVVHDQGLVLLRIQNGEMTFSDPTRINVLLRPMPDSVCRDPLCASDLSGPTI